MQLKNINHSFDVPVGQTGVTIRKGTKWADVPFGEMLGLFNCTHAHTGDCCTPENPDCRFEGTGVKNGNWTGTWADLPDELVSMEHNDAAKDKEVLRQMMATAYGEMKPDDVVTALFYKRLT